MHTTNIENYISRIAVSPGKIYGEFMRVVKISRRAKFWYIHERELKKIEGQRIVSDHEKEQIIRIIDII
jgi:hypothetical protein